MDIMDIYDPNSVKKVICDLRVEQLEEWCRLSGVIGQHTDGVLCLSTQQAEHGVLLHNRVHVHAEKVATKGVYLCDTCDTLPDIHQQRRRCIHDWR